VIAALVLAALTGAPVPGTLVDRVVAVVDKQVVTQSELLLEARVALLLREGEIAATADLDDQALHAFLDYLVNQLLVAGQARRLGAVEVSAGEVEHDLRELARRFRSPDAYRAFLRRFDASEDQLRNILARNRRNERFIADRMRLIGAADRLVDPSSPQYQQALRKWLDELRDAVDVRLLGPTDELELQPRRVQPTPAAGPEE
jgi:hypothetical protein